MTLTNVTIDPRAPATSVEAPEILEIIDLESGKILNTRDFIQGHTYGDLVAARVDVRTGTLSNKPRYACALCSTPVYLVASVQKRFFFRHKAEDGSCPAITRGELTADEILARKYHGLRESDAHKRIKGFIERSLKADPTFTAHSILTEQRWNSASDPAQWRKPDVQAASSEGKVAFEVQLSTTFLGVVAARRAFYQAEGAHLVWVFGHFSPDYRRMTTDDVLFSNNSNIFVVDEETTAMSERERAFHLRCHYREPFVEDGRIQERWCEKVIPFAALKNEQHRQRVYFFDFDAEEAKCRFLLGGDVRQAVLKFWRQNMTPDHRFSQENEAEWKRLRARLAAQSVPVPEHASEGRFRTMMNAILSALDGKPVGWKFSTLIQCAHQIAERHPEYLAAFGFAVRIAGHQELLEAQDHTRKWSARMDEIKPLLAKRDPKYLPDQTWAAALEFLFPDVAAKVAAFAKPPGLAA